jgi:hypothetical protein
MVDNIITKREALTKDRTRVKAIETTLNKGNEDTVSSLLLQEELEALLRNIDKLETHIQNAESKLSAETAAPSSSAADPRYKRFYQVKVNARALKHRIRLRVVEYKFEHRKLERSYRSQVNRKPGIVQLLRALPDP